MTNQRKLEILGAVITILLAACFLRAWVLERESRIRAEVITSAAEQTVASKNADIAARDAATGKLTAALAAKSAAVTTAPQAVQVIEHYMPAPIATPIPVVQRTELPAAIQAELPADADPKASVGVVTDKQLVQIAKDELAGESCRQTLNTCQADAIDLHAVITAKTTEANTWQAAAKGGTKLQRVGKVLKFTGCAAGGAFVGSLFKSSSATAIGAGAAVVGCSLF